MKRTLIALALLITILFTACTGVVSSASIDGSWKLSTINGQPALAGTNVTAKIGNGEVSGSAGCNSYSGKYSVSGSKVNVKDLVSTMMACDGQGVMDQESAFLKAMGEANSFALNNGNLEVKNSGGDTILVFSAE
jgi:heat shock protein HslJ